MNVRCSCTMFFLRFLSRGECINKFR